MQLLTKHCVKLKKIMTVLTKKLLEIINLLIDILFKNKLEEALKVTESIRDLERQSYKLTEELNELKAENTSHIPKCAINSYEMIKFYLYRIISSEIYIKPVPTIEELKEDITIAAIDEEFNVETFVNNLIEKFK